VVEEECPEPKDGEVRVRVLAAGVAYPDLLMREGVHPEKPPLPFTPGWDLIGVVDRPGMGVSGIEPGQMIAALPISGAYAECVCRRQFVMLTALNRLANLLTKSSTSFVREFYEKSKARSTDSGQDCLFFWSNNRKQR